MRIVADVASTCVIVVFRLKWDRLPPGETPLMLGSRKGHLEIVKYLVGMKANIEAKEIYGG